MEIDPISEVLGQLVAENKEAQRQRTAMFSKLDKLESESLQQRALLETHMAEFQRHTEEELRRYSQYVEPAIVDYQKTKTRAIAVLMTVAAMGAAAWELIQLIIKKVLP